MSPLMTTIANASSTIWEATALVGAAVVAMGARSIESARKPKSAASVDSRTMQDIGVEPGSLTWIR